MTNVYKAALLTLTLAVPALASAQPSVTKSNTQRTSATIQAIDSTTRMVTLKTKSGERSRSRPART